MIIFLLKNQIIVISNGETEAGQLIEKYKIGKNINLQHLPLAETLLEIINTSNFNQLNEMQYNYFSRENQNLKFYKYLMTEIPLISIIIPVYKNEFF